MRKSIQRDTILKIVSESHDHPSAYDVYDKIKEIIPKISLGTVYRDLGVLSDMGLIKKITIPGTVDLFDGNTKIHFHSRCNVCGKITDIKDNDIKIMDFLKENISDQVIDCEVNIKVICKDCQKK